MYLRKVPMNENEASSRTRAHYLMLRLTSGGDGMVGPKTPGRGSSCTRRGQRQRHRTFDETLSKSCPRRYNHYNTNTPLTENPKFSADCGTGIIFAHSFHPPQNHSPHP